MQRSHPCTRWHCCHSARLDVRGPDRFGPPSPPLLLALPGLRASKGVFPGHGKIARSPNAGKASRHLCSHRRTETVTHATIKRRKKLSLSKYRITNTTRPANTTSPPSGSGGPQHMCVCRQGVWSGGGAGERPHTPIYITLKRTPAGSSQREGASERESKRRPHSPRSRFWHMIKAHRESSEGTPKAAQGAPGTTIQRRHHVGTPGDSTKERTGHRRTHPFLDDARMGASSE